ncbi:MAG: hypothetical protein QOE70_5459 [Chthoniobacter sp.]|nr:hypothetical protein [Chthoniobacter sp.]
MAEMNRHLRRTSPTPPCLRACFGAGSRFQPTTQRRSGCARYLCSGSNLILGSDHRLMIETCPFSTRDCRSPATLSPLRSKGTCEAWRRQATGSFPSSVRMEKFCRRLAESKCGETYDVALLRLASALLDSEDFCSLFLARMRNHACNPPAANAQDNILGVRGAAGRR